MSPSDTAKDLSTEVQQGTEALAVPRTTMLGRLFEEHNRALHSFLNARLLQLDQPGAISFLRAYLFKTAVNIAVDRSRQRRSRGRLDQIFSQQEIVDSATPDRHLLASEDLAIVEQALYELPPKYRRAFILRRYHERTPEEIADELGIRTRMVRNYICRTTIYCKLRLDGVSAAEARNRVIP
jgi:RNA polymerase sigma factor (sigma-70 family)